MKRFHVHLGVADLDASIRFYSAMFGTEPTVSKTDYAKWMLDDPRLNFAISTRGKQPGLDHLGMQTESGDELVQLRDRFAAAELPTLSQTNTTCCYASADKHWTLDPQDIAWESFHTLSDAPVFGEGPSPAMDAKAAKACCIPLAKTTQAKPGSCCVPNDASSCCN